MAQRGGGQHCRQKDAEQVPHPKLSRVHDTESTTRTIYLSRDHEVQGPFLVRESCAGINWQLNPPPAGQLRMESRQRHAAPQRAPGRFRPRHRRRPLATTADRRLLAAPRRPQIRRGFAAAPSRRAFANDPGRSPATDMPAGPALPSPPAPRARNRLPARQAAAPVRPMRHWRPARHNRLRRMRRPR